MANPSTSLLAQMQQGVKPISATNNLQNFGQNVNTFTSSVNSLASTIGGTAIIPAGTVTQLAQAGQTVTQLASAITTFDIAKAISIVKGLGQAGGLFNQGFTSDIPTRAQYLKDNNVDDPRGWPPKDSTYLDFFINFVDDWTNSNTPLNEYNIRSHPEWIFQFFTPDEWDNVVDKIIASPYPAQYTNGDWNKSTMQKFYYLNLVVPYIKTNKPTVYTHILQAASDRINGTNSSNTNNGGNNTPDAPTPNIPIIAGVIAVITLGISVVAGWIKF